MIKPSRLIALLVVVANAWYGAISSVSANTTIVNNDEADGATVTSVATAAAAAATIGVVRRRSDISENENGIVSIDFDVPRYGPICISIDENDIIEFVWNEYHNLHFLPNEKSYVECDFSEAIPLVPEGRPNPSGYMIEASIASSTQTTNPVIASTEIYNDIFATSNTTIRYFSCSKICSSNGHKVKVCAGGFSGQRNECYNTDDCTENRTVDVRTRMQSLISNGNNISVTPKPKREYVPVGRVCRPKNDDGYSILSGIDTPQSCQQKCDNDAPKCGAWEFENYDGGDNRECELHESNVISYDETIDMGDCEKRGIENITDDLLEEELGEVYYRCCWITKEIVDLQTNTTEITTEQKLISKSGAIKPDKICCQISLLLPVVMMFSFFLII
mmetsp:Transcript_53828/g.58367  ORF Transcript_53828/g.58367 Transcript_53828/m.58367 type:complete len:390 (-) Transcript_53828:2951-4120(-)